VDIEYALIADAADISGGKLYLMGGGWDTYTLREAPGHVRLAIAVGVRLGWEETNHAAPIRVTVADDDNQELVRLETSVNVGRPAHLAPGSTQLAQMAVNIPLNVPRHGGYRVIVRAGEAPNVQERALPFRVVAP
jgi:hypothetical protein